MKVVHVLNYFLPEQTAGTEVYVYALASTLRNLNVDVEVEVLIPNHRQIESIVNYYDGIKVVKYAEPSIPDRKLIMGKRIPDGLVNFISYLKESTPDIVHFHEINGSSGITVHHINEAKKIGVKVLMTFHLAGNSCITGTLKYLSKEKCDGEIQVEKCAKCLFHSKQKEFYSHPVFWISKLFSFININTTQWNSSLGTALGLHYLIREHKEKFHKLINNCDRVVSITDWYKKILLLNGVPENKITIIKQALYERQTEGNTAAEKKLNAPLKLLFLGRISAFKGLHLLIDAISEFSKENLTLDIYGQSTDLDYELDLKRKTKSVNHISWMGTLNPAEVISEMKNYDLLCLCSTFSEMSPLVIQEAFAAGLPVIASDVYGNSEQIKNGVNGLLFEFGNVQSLKSGIQRILQDRSMLEKFKKQMPAPRLFDSIGKEYYQLYAELLDDNNSDI